MEQLNKRKKANDKKSSSKSTRRVSSDGTRTCKHTPVALAEVEKPDGFFACPGTASGDIKCMKDCKKCVETNESIWFHIHGTKKKKIHDFEITAKLYS